MLAVLVVWRERVSVPPGKITGIFRSFPNFSTTNPANIPVVPRLYASNSR
jgi:hypothetical protein